MEDEMQVSFKAYQFIRVEEGEINNDFETLLLYEAADINLYSEHHFRAEVQALMPEADPEPDIFSCPKCGWILSVDATVCIKCKSKFDGQGHLVE
jgi:hypothetical protein